MPACLAELKDPKGFIATPKGWSLDISSGTFDLDYVVEKIQDGTFIPFIGANEFTDNTPDPTTKEFTSGITLVVRNGYPTYQFQYNKEYAFHKAAYTYNSNRAYNYLIVDSVGNIFAATNDAGTHIVGFNGGMLNTRTLQFNDGGAELFRTLVDIQIISPDQFNGDGVILTASQNGFSAIDEIYAIMDVNIEATAPAAGDPIVVRVKATANPSFDIEGLVAANFRVLVDGVASPIDTVTFNASTFEYSIDPTSAFVAAEEVVVEMYDATNSINVAVDAGNMLYKGVSQAVTVTA